MIPLFIDNRFLLQSGDSCDGERCERIHPRVGAGGVLGAAGGGKGKKLMRKEEINESG